MPARTIISALLVCLGGCVDHPSGLRLAVELQEQSIGTNEALQLKATLTAEEGPLAIGKGAHISVEIRNAADERIGSGGRIAKCGLHVLALWPFYLAATPVWAADVADGCGRYIVLEQDEQESFRLQIALRRNEFIAVLDMESDEGEFRPNIKEPWAPGSYKLLATLQSANPWAPPIFWKPYDHPITAEVEFTVVADTSR